MKRRLIDADDFLDLFYVASAGQDSMFIKTVEMVVEDTPTIDAAEVVHGRWIPTYHTYYNRDGACQIADEWHCSECNFFVRDRFNYCPNCVAKMDGEENG